MNLHEYQAKEILERYGVNVPRGVLAFSADDARKAAVDLIGRGCAQRFVVKAQVHAGGRGKGGGVKVAASEDEVFNLAKEMIGMRLVTHQTSAEGKVVRKVLVVEDVYGDGTDRIHEYYFSITLDRRIGKYVIVYSTQGGVDIEEVARLSPEEIFKEVIEPVGLQEYQLRKIGFRLGLSGVSLASFTEMVKGAFNAFVLSDASLLEINPLLKAKDGQMLAVDAKMSIDDSALYRQPNIALYRDADEEEPSEVEASLSNLSFVKLDGNVGCMVNGAGLAMATMDLVKSLGAYPANFLDIGGGASPERVGEGLRIILKDKNVKVVLINIFGGIVRCDRVAEGILAAFSRSEPIDVPVVVRLQGTNAAEGRRILEESSFHFSMASTLMDAARLIERMLTR